MKGGKDLSLDEYLPPTFPERQRGSENKAPRWTTKVYEDERERGGGNVETDAGHICVMLVPQSSDTGGRKTKRERM